MYHLKFSLLSFETMDTESNGKSETIELLTAQIYTYPDTALEKRIIAFFFLKQTCHVENCLKKFNQQTLLKVE